MRNFRWHKTSRALDEAVNDVKNSGESRQEYMVMMIREMEIREEGREEGREEAMKEAMEEAMEEGMALFGALIARLLSLGRNGDIQRAATDRAYRTRLLEEFHLA